MILSDDKPSRGYHVANKPNDSPQRRRKNKWNNMETFFARICIEMNRNHRNITITPVSDTHTYTIWIIPMKINHQELFFSKKKHTTPKNKNGWRRKKPTKIKNTVRIRCFAHQHSERVGFFFSFGTYLMQIFCRRWMAMGFLNDGNKPKFNSILWPLVRQCHAHTQLTKFRFSSRGFFFLSVFVGCCCSLLNKFSFNCICSFFERWRFPYSFVH